MVQKYDELKVKSPGTVIISAAANCNDILNIIEPVFQNNDQNILNISITFKNKNEDDLSKDFISYVKITIQTGSLFMDRSFICVGYDFKKSFRRFLRNDVGKNGASQNHFFSSSRVGRVKVKKEKVKQWVSEF